VSLHGVSTAPSLHRVRIPDDVKAGQPFNVVVDGKTYQLRAPQHLKPGEEMTFQLAATTTPQVSRPLSAASQNHHRSQHSVQITSDGKVVPESMNNTRSQYPPPPQYHDEILKYYDYTQCCFTMDRFNYLPVRNNRVAFMQVGLWGSKPGTYDTAAYSFTKVRISPALKQKVEATDADIIVIDIKDHPIVDDVVAKYSINGGSAQRTSSRITFIRKEPHLCTGCCLIGYVHCMVFTIVCIPCAIVIGRNPPRATQLTNCYSLAQISINRYSDVQSLDVASSVAGGAASVAAAMGGNGELRQGSMA